MPKQYLDKTGLTRFNSAINNKLNNKVDKDGTKVLSSNDFTNAYKTNVDSNTSARHTHTNKTILDGISSADISTWNGKSSFSGSYNDLTNKPTIPQIIKATNESDAITKSSQNPTNLYYWTE